MKNVCLSLIALMCFGCSSTQKSPFISVNDVTDETPADQLVRDEDGLGAGDAFVGVLAAEWVGHQNLRQAAEQANRAAAASVLCSGAQVSCVRQEEFKNWGLA